jgi:regulator of replication initiation timing
MSEEQLNRRDALLQAMDAAEEGTLETPADKELDVVQDDIAKESVEVKTSHADNEESAEVSEELEFEESHEDAEEEAKPVTRPSTWKKEYVQIWDKMEAGQQISKEDFTKFAEYANQRESEYKKGVSTYKAEADRARGYEEAIAPFIPELQAQNISPAAWINNLGRAHMVLSKAPYSEKVQMFQRLAQDYGIQLGEDGMSVPQTDAYTQQLMNQLNQVNQEVSTIKNRFQQEEQTRLMLEIERVRSDVEKFPHFDVVREEMAQLLELGKAQDLETAYKKAVRMNDDVWALEQERLLTSAKQASSKAQQVAKAKTVAVSPKSSTPRGTVATTDKKDRRALLSEQLGEAMARRV